MADVNISKYRASVVREGSKPASPGFVVSEGQSPTDPAGSGQNHLPVTIAPASTGLAITESQILGGAGTVGQYIRGDGSLADFPATTGGGSSVSYYLNGSVSQGTIGGVAYRELNRTPIFGAGTDISINADGYIASFITDAGDPNKLLIPAGNWNFETYFSASSSGGSPSFYVELYKYNGSNFTLIASSSSSPELIAFGTNLNPYFSTLAVPETVLALTDRLAVRFYVTHSGRTITLHTENGHLCQIITSFTTGLTALNGLTTQVQFFAVGTSGTDFNITSSVDTHTFNLPTASGTNRGALSSADWSTFNNKENAITAGTTAQYFRGDKTFQTLNTSVVPEGTNLYYTEARVNANTNVAANTAARHNAVTLGTANGLSLSTQVLSLGLASAGVTGALSGTDWSTFNNKQNALTNPVTGTGTTNYLAKFTGSTTVGNSQVFDNGTNVGIGTASPFWKLTISNDVTSSDDGQLMLIGSTSSAKRFSIGYNTTSNFGFMQAYQNGVGYNNLIINPSGGNLLVGTTTDNGFRLDVNGTGRFSNQITGPSGAVTEGKFNFIGYNNGYGGITANTGFDSSYNSVILYSNFNSNRSGQGNTSIPSWQLDLGGSFPNQDSFSIYRSSAGSFTFTNLFKITSGGNVGIGTASPLSKLEVVNSAGSQLLIGYNAAADNYYDAANHFFRSASGASNRVFISGISGNVGIGTTSPNRLLTVSGTQGLIALNATSYRNTTIGSDSVGNFIVYDDTAAAYRMVINSSGNVGIGTTAPKSYSGFNVLTIGNDSSGGILSFRSSYNSGNGAEIYQNSSGNLLFNPNSALTALAIVPNGNVGIGTTSPASRLQIEGTGTGAWLTINRTDSGTNVIDYTQSGTRLGYIGYIVNDLFINNSTASSTVFFTAGTERMRITSTGNVGIGTASPGRKLQINVTPVLGEDDGINVYNGTTNFLFTRTASTYTYRGVAPLSGMIYCENNITLLSDGGNITFNNSGSERMRITSGGNVGIGTTSPQTAGGGYTGLHINGNGASLVLSTNGSNLAYLYTSGTGGADFRIENPGAQIFSAGSTERMRITSGGNVGIGTSSPGARLNIAGNLGAVVGAGNSAIRMTNTDSGNYASIGAGIVGVDNPGMQFSVDGTSRMVITGSGNVLIGTTTDNGAKLNVNGTIRTANPTGSTSDGWLLGRALVSGSSTPDRWIRVQIGNLYYDILSRYIGSV